MGLCVASYNTLSQLIHFLGICSYSLKLLTLRISFKRYNRAITNVNFIKYFLNFNDIRNYCILPESSWTHSSFPFSLTSDCHWVQNVFRHIVW